MVAGFADEADIFLLPRVGKGTEHLVLQHVRKADDRIERGAQFMAHHAEEPALGKLDRAGVFARFGQCCAQRRQFTVLPEHRHYRL